MRKLSIETPQVFGPLLGPARYKGAHGGRGSGKSHFFAESLVAECLKRRTRAVCVREIQRSLEQSVKRLIEDKIASLKVGSQFRILDSHIETPYDGIIIFQGMQNHTAESIKSLEGYRIAWVEEAQGLSKRSLTLLRPTIREPGSELWFSWNPRSPRDAVDELLRKEKPPDAAVVQANYESNPWFPQELRDEMEYDRRRDPERYKHVWLGEYLTNSEARVFHNWRIEEFATPPDARFYFGADWGFSVDPTVLVRCWIDGRTLYVDAEAWQVGCELDHTPALFAKVPGALAWPIIADSANPQSISYMVRHGFPKMRASVKGVGSIEEGVEFLKSYDIVVHPRCKHVADELATYSYEIDKLTEQVLPKLADDKNHTIDSLRYAIEPLRRAVPQLKLGGY
jgi:phage terminase large subunit